ncbi:uncharacterized protein LOC106131620 [Amyelois transitella]|uniref:uncharacterized protein LOC106131620 n=1 Tax=Amyelois transitella TaxID=680683 RepID=UPI0029900AEB|nr:uncharacterized protein LOC106131620 [Amyelois transitella]
MKFAIAFLAVLAVASAQFFNQPRRAPFPAPAPPRPLSPSRSSGNDANANIVRYESSVNPDGAFSYAVETDNGIAAQAQGTPRDFGGNPPVVPVVIQGSYSFLTPEGEQVAISYTADENGYQPSGSALPTPPPVPPQIQRALDFIARNPPRYLFKMKFAVVALACLAVANAAFPSFPSSLALRNRPAVPFAPSAPVPPRVQPVARVSADARSANIVKQGSEINPDGSYNYFYETDNGIAAQEQGTPRNFGGNPPVIPDVAQGSFSWTSPEGQPIAISYIADENGYQPQGDAIPTPPPVPAQIARALEYIARNAPRK